MQRHSTQRGRVAVIAATILLFLSASAHAQVSSIATKLLGRIDSRRISEGAPIFVRAISSWKQGRCSVPAGATFEGRIAKVVRRGPGAKREEIALRFSSTPCSGDDSLQVIPILVAMRGPQKNSNDDMVARTELLSAFASAVGGHPPVGTGGASSPGSPRQGIDATLTQGGYIPATSNQGPLRVGEVRDFPRIKLSLPAYTSEPTTLSSSGEFFFDPDTQFVLALRIAASRIAPNSSSIATARAASVPEQPAAGNDAKTPDKVPRAPAQASLPALIENCVTGGCVTAPDAMHVTAERAQTEVSLHDLGYRARTGETVMGGLEDNSAIAFLGDDQVFITFNPHPLVPRSETEAERNTSPRQIRGVLLSAVDGRRLRVVDWHVPDQGAYLWPLDESRILVHVDNAFVVYSRDLQEEARWEIPGPLLFVTISPSRTVILAAVKHERYDAATFRRLAGFIGSPDKVQEDCDLIALNRQLEQTSSRRLAEVPALPPLLDSGMISMIPEQRSRWKIEETDWNNHGRRLAELASACAPLVQTLSANLLFISGCKADSSSKWYRMLRSDGKTLLRGTTSNAAIPEYADASASGSVFAIGVEHALASMDWGIGIFVGDLESMTISVYRTSDGRQIYATKVPSHAVDRRVFALSPSGRRLAVLVDSEVCMYPIHGAP